MDKPLAIILALFTFLLGMLFAYKVCFYLPYRDNYPTISDMTQEIATCEKSLPRDKHCVVVLDTSVVDGPKD